MPRPKRSRVAPSRPAAAAPSSATPPAVTQPTTSTSYPKAPSSDIYDVSDREKQRPRTRASGNLAATRRGFEADSEQARALEDSKRRRDKAMDRLDNITSTSRPVDSASAEDNAGSPDIEYSRRESVSMAGASRPARLTDASGLDLDDDIFGNLDDSLEDSHADDTKSAHQTRSTDTSSFNITMFRRKPRQSSIIGKDDAPIRPSSRGPNTPSISSHLNLGRFKRRQREPSILGTAQKDRAPRPQSQASNYGSVMGEGDSGPEESGPEDESTPLDKTKRHSGPAPPADISRETSPPTLPTRKRKSLEEQTGREKRLALDDPDEEDVVHQSIEVDSTPPESPSIRAASVHDHPSTPIQSDDPNMAPPASSGSSSGSSPVVWPPLDSLAHRTYHARHRAAVKTPEHGGNDAASDMSSPPSLTHSPNYAPIEKTKPKPKPAAAAPLPKVTTADLTSLLPRRRHKARGDGDGSDGEDPYDLDSSDENGRPNEEDDELSYVDSRAARRKRAAALAQTTTNRNSKSAKDAATAAGTTKRGARTYGSRNSDKENEEGEEALEEEAAVELGSEAEDEDSADASMWDAETSQMMEARMGEELKNAARKFQEVDRWELSFEEVEKSSSPIPEAR